MAKINTLNYQTVAAWNGSQDLFVVEQPDGTKVATPAMVKQFIEAGDFEATGEITDGHGNILKDMAKSADVNTALAGKQNTLTFDAVPTASSTNPVTSGGVYTALNNVETISDQGSYGCGYTAYKYGKVVVLLVSGITNATTGQSMQLFTLPTGWRPKNFMRVIGSTLVASLNGTNLVGFNIYSSGVCETYSYTAFTNGLFSCAYMVD